MNRVLLSTIAVVLAASGAACSKGPERASGISSHDNVDTGTSSGGDSDTEVTDSAATDTDSGSVDIDSSAPSDAPPATDTGSLPDGTSVDAPTSAACPKGYSEVPGTAVSYAMSSDDLLAGITWDELTIAWATQSGGVPTVQYADRTSRDGAFGTPRTLPDALGKVQDKVAFSADGLTLIVVSHDGLAIKQVTRASRSAAFDASTVTSKPFERLLASSGEPGSTATKVADIVLSYDGKTLWYTDLNKTSGSSIRVSVRLTDGTFDFPNAVTTPRLRMDAGSRRRPTGISADSRVLFFWDEVDETGYTAFRTGSSIEFGEFYALAPNGKRAMPNDTCGRFYASLVKVLDEDTKTEITQIYRVP